MAAATLLATVSAFGFSHPKLAPSASHCWDSDCLLKGWTQLQRAGGGFTDTSCRDGDCALRGWLANGNAGLSYYVSCKEPGCLTAGWYEVELNTQRLLREVVCEKGHCLRFGWTAYEKLTGEIYRSECVAENCETQGWNTLLPGYQWVTSRCLEGKCFVHGWEER